eukprot:gnl/TRDRNA2_/TRDRNA2_131522_c0_seq3.p1 gnl/TRDRNA2_/TRDRNA2_131522_c0~~gnl/TRDRNA2_/TRDRNA2_131522_c0_seq3.p1  ORF type:complete len:801 (-),score=192.88 gnl/TRDRNA2_/TRDRNA2_131522_c0_seq3:86-2134(-)
MLTPKLTKGEVSPHDVSTDSGDDSPSNGDSSGSSDNEMCESFCSDHVAATETSSVDEFADVLVYPLTIMLQLRAAVGRRFAPPLRYGTQPREGPKVLNSSKASVANDVPAWRQRAQKTTDAQKKSKLPAASSNSWLAQQARSKDQHDEDEKVERACRSILNKLTVEKFDSLYEQLGSSCGIRSPNHLALLMREIFEKATVQHHFIPMYADLCVRLEKDPRLASAMGPEGGPSSFRHLLLNQCQSSFEDLLESRARNSSTASDEDSESQEQLEGLCKRRALGNIRLVGQLMVRGMLHSRLLVQCCDELLSGKDMCPEALECLCALLTVTGPTFDKPDYKHHDRFCAIFSRVAELTRDKTVHSRVRFLLRDVLDLRQARWKTSSRTEKGPMKLEEVKAAQQKDVEVKATAPLRRRDEETKAPKKPVVEPRAAEIKERRDPLSAARLDKLKTIVDSTVKELPQPMPQPAEKESPSTSATTRCRKKKSASKPNKSSENPAASCTKAQPEPEPAAQPEAVQPRAPAVSEPAPVAAAAEAMPAVPGNPEAFDLRAFHRELSATLRELCADRNVASAVRRVRAQNVPVKFQAAEFANIVTRAAEETRGPARRSSFAFAAGLAAADTSAFDKQACLDGIRVFFDEVYEDLCTEVPRLPAIVSAELVPTLRSVLPLSNLNTILPEELRVAA